MSLVGGQWCTAADLVRWDKLVAEGVFPSREIAMAAQLAEEKERNSKRSRTSGTRKKPRRQRKTSKAREKS